VPLKAFCHRSGQNLRDVPNKYLGAWSKNEWMSETKDMELWKIEHDLSKGQVA